MKGKMPNFARCLAIICLCSSAFSLHVPSSVADVRGADPADCAGVAPTGALLLRPTSTTGTPSSGLIVVDPSTGDELRRIGLPLVDVAIPTPIPDLAIAISGAELYLIDTATR